MAVMDNAVNDGSCKLLIGEQPSPVAEGQIRGYDQRLLFIAVGDDAEQVPCALAVD